MANEILEALRLEFADALDVGRLTHVAVRLLAAALFGSVLGYQREQSGKAAGLRTHMLVTVGAAFFVTIPELESIETADLSRVIQGVITGIGFLGGGAILKLEHDRQVKGLTTAAGIWMAAAIGIAVGFGRLGSALLGTVAAFLILETIYRLEVRISKSE